jgi:hypothetical protein
MSKKPNRGQFLVFAGILLATYAGYTLYKKYKQKKAEQTGGGGTTTTGTRSGGGTSTTTAPKDIFANFPLKKGSSGILVKQLQQALLAQGGKLPKYGADGKFGDETQAALKSLYNITSVDEARFKYITEQSPKAKAAASSTKSSYLPTSLNTQYTDSIGLKF